MPENDALFQPVPPPRLHWLIVLVLSFVTGGIFGSVWLVVQANWCRSVRGHSRAYAWTLAGTLYTVLQLGFQFFPLSARGVIFPLLAVLLTLSGVVVWITARFTLRSELQEEPVGLTLGAVMTFFFSEIYFQFHLQDYPVEALGFRSRVGKAGKVLGL